MTVPKTRDPGRESRAMRFMIVAVLGYSIIPVFIAVMDTHRAPFLFTAFMYAGSSWALARTRSICIPSCSSDHVRAGC